MKINFTLFFLFFSMGLLAQTPDLSPTRRVFVVSGMGFGFPMGGIKETLKPKFSSSIGLNIPTRGALFFYPVVDFLRFGYYERLPDENYTHRIQNGTSNLYGLSFMPGYSKSFGSLTTYAYAGPSLHWVHEPRSGVDASAGEVSIEKFKYFTAGGRAGAGAHYRAGNFYLFLETSWVGNFHGIQDHRVNVLNVFAGLKTDVTDLTQSIGDLLKGGATPQ